MTTDAAQHKTLGAAGPALTFLASPLLLGAGSFSGHLSRAAGENVGSYAITLGDLSAGGNYTLSLSGTVNFAINAKPVMITTDARSEERRVGKDGRSWWFVPSWRLHGRDSFTGGWSR